MMAELAVGKPFRLAQKLTQSQPLCVARTPQAKRSPNWDSLFAVAQGQDGYFTTTQAAQSGYSRPLLHKH